MKRSSVKPRRVYLKPEALLFAKLVEKLYWQGASLKEAIGSAHRYMEDMRQGLILIKE